MRRFTKTTLSCLVALALCILSVCTGALAAPADWTNTILGVKLEKAEPQDDFYAYVNSDWVQKAELPAGYSNISIFEEMTNTIREQVIDLLEGENASFHEAELAQTFYRLMVDMDKRNADGVGMLIKDIEEIEAIDSIEALNAYLLEPDCTNGVLLVADITLDFMDSTLYVGACSNIGFLLEDAAEYTQRTANGNRIDEANSYVMRKVFAHIGRTEEEGEALYRSALDLESRLAPYAYTTEDEYSPDYYQKVYNIYSAEDLKQLNSAFPLVELIEAKGLLDSPFFIILNPEYHAACDAVYNQENLEALKALMISACVIDSVSNFDQACLDIYNEAMMIRNGSTGSLPLEESAYNTVSSLLPGAVGRMYVEAYLSDETVRDVTAMIDQIIAVFRSRLEKADWLTAETRERAIGKLDGMTARVGYSGKWAEYSQLQIDADASYYEAIENYYLFCKQRSAERVGTRVDPDEWDYPSHDVNAYYNPQDNSINILAGILVPPFYTPGGSFESNLGGIGTVIGHEITHAFDSSGSQFDVNGNMINWWTEEDFAAFEERTKKVEDYLSAIEVQPGLNVNGTMTQGEAIADMGGVSVGLEIAETIEGFDYESFFETYAKLWAILHTQESMELRVLNDPHPLGYLRCNITLQQFDEFHETYNVQEGDGMYLAPEDRITVW